MESGNDFRRVAVEAVKEAGKVIRENFGHVKDLRIKHGDWRDLVTDVDLKSNQIIMEILKENFPEHNIISEESKPLEKESDYTWFVDPMDGTTNYTLAIPFIGTCMGLVFRGKPILGVVYNPIIDELFVGESGKGATMNGNKIRVSENSELKKTLVNFCHDNTSQSIEIVEKLFAYFKTNSRDYRRLGSGSLDICWVACGRNDIYFRPDMILHDVVPGYVIAKEAGAKITDWQDRPWVLESKDLLATNGTKIHEEVLEIINRSK